jgi:hypothetical protein
MKSLILRTVVNHEPGDAVTYFWKTAAAASQLGSDHGHLSAHGPALK